MTTSCSLYIWVPPIRATPRIDHVFGWYIYAVAREYWERRTIRPSGDRALKSDAGSVISRRATWNASRRREQPSSFYTKSPFISLKFFQQYRFYDNNETLGSRTDYSFYSIKHRYFSRGQFFFAANGESRSSNLISTNAVLRIVYSLSTGLLL